MATSPVIRTSGISRRRTSAVTVVAALLAVVSLLVLTSGTRPGADARSQHSASAPARSNPPLDTDFPPCC
ncbi:hypothetical protein SAMN05428944_0447 [Streptomyces sp. 1222.5]|uniref:hypothetical protein n=1 Tax=unclassified Streptomyces TaxID=2593676 RepID=UPI00089A2B68|nr:MULTISPECIES: hypothetical protein [unclassified Streptomyces]PKW12304.1 hypothetical protein BX260_7649 [Streptomyces sp. 5112.2]SEB58752.1 hypothetical protein SAMN05428944_0447 [Streptomyces sp. 1222.5]SEE35865.1 hypothetical protein SAMN05216532_7904 [Streptomyces sp. 2231.1]